MSSWKCSFGEGRGEGGGESRGIPLPTASLADSQLCLPCENPTVDTWMECDGKQTLQEWQVGPAESGHGTRHVE